MRSSTWRLDIGGLVARPRSLTIADYKTRPRGVPSSGEHSVRSRAFDLDGNVQQTPEDPFLTSRRTYWESNVKSPGGS